jgi:hypothetical protein
MGCADHSIATHFKDIFSRLDLDGDKGEDPQGSGSGEEEDGPADEPQEMEDEDADSDVSMDEEGPKHEHSVLEGNDRLPLLPRHRDVRPPIIRLCDDRPLRETENEGADVEEDSDALIDELRAEDELDKRDLLLASMAEKALWAEFDSPLPIVSQPSASIKSESSEDEKDGEDGEDGELDEEKEKRKGKGKNAVTDAALRTARPGTGKVKSQLYVLDSD